MSKFESSIKQIPYSQQAVYNMLSDLSNIERVRDRIPEDKIKDLKFDTDSVSVNVSPVGEVKFNIIERQEPKCIKFQSVQSPVPVTLWIQVLPMSDTESKMKLTVDADIPFILKGMVSGPLQEGIEKIADALAMIHYE